MQNPDQDFSELDVERVIINVDVEAGAALMGFLAALPAWVEVPVAHSVIPAANAAEHLP